ncbi:MAG: PIN domain-containing protein [Actinomycetes bacterium]|jgi:predicted nucleic acid-binding protein|nr:PIN domain-containing protein [Actinomycetes bacterium]
MKILLDTNIVLDALGSREPFCRDAEQIILSAAAGHVQGFLTANAVTDIVYVLRKQLTGDVLKQRMTDLMDVLPVLDVNEADCRAAFSQVLSDYEDALMLQCAQRHGLDAVVSRDAALLKYDTRPNGIDVLSPQMLLDSLSDAT